MKPKEEWKQALQAIKKKMSRREPVHSLVVRIDCDIKAKDVGEAKTMVKSQLEEKLRVIARDFWVEVDG